MLTLLHDLRSQLFDHVEGFEVLLELADFGRSKNHGRDAVILCSPRQRKVAGSSIETVGTAWT